jgi:hypothetical protein
LHASKLITIATLGLALTLTGCGALTPDAATTPAATPMPVAGAAGWIPSTFSAEGIWTATVDDGSPLAVGNSGVATVSRNTISVRDAATGAVLWSSTPTTGSPALSFASDNGKEFLLAAYGSGTSEARIDAYLTTHSGENVAPRSTSRFVSEDGENVTIKASSSGALVSIGAERKAYRPDHPDAPVVAANARALVNDSILTVDPSGTFGLEGITGASVWSSSKVKPAGAKPDTQGTFLAESNGLIAAKWPGTDGKDLLVLLRAVGGTVAATAPAAAAGPPGALLASTDGRWGAYGRQVINASTGAVYELPADLSAALVDRAVVYSSGAHGSAYDAIGKISIPSPKGAPKMVTPQGQGVFISGTEMTIAQMNSLGAKVTG